MISVVVSFFWVSVSYYLMLLSYKGNDYKFACLFAVAMGCQFTLLVLSISKWIAHFYSAENF